MLVTTRIRIFLTVAAFTLLAATQCLAYEAMSYDLGAGPVNAQVNDCLMANRAHRGPPCPEPPVSQSADKQEQSASHLARARYFVDMQDFEKARAETDQALALDPDNLKARHLSARLSFTLGDHARAESDLALARKQAPDDADIHATYAYFLYGKGANFEAFREYQDIISKHPNHRFAREQRARLLMLFHRYNDALVDLNFVVEGDRPGTIGLELRAQAFLALGKPQSAAADMSAAMAKDPDRADLLQARAEAYVRAQLYELALRDYDTLLSTTGGAPLYPMMDNERGKIMAQRAFTLVQMRRFADAANDMIVSMRVGGVQTVLRAQVFLRHNGFPDVPIDGTDSPALRKALAACFGLDSCFAGIKRAI